MANDKLPLERFVGSVIDGFLSGAESALAKHPEWEMGALTITARVALKPSADGQSVVADLDEPDRLMSEIPIPLRRKSG